MTSYKERIIDTDTVRDIPYGKPLRGSSGGVVQANKEKIWRRAENFPYGAFAPSLSEKGLP